MASDFASILDEYADHLTPKPHRVLPEVLTQVDATTMMDALATRAAEEETPISMRDVAIVELLYATGARVSEICGLDISDIDFSRNTIRVLGKGNKERTLPFGVPAARVLNNYLDIARPQIANDKSSTALFLGVKGKRG